MKLKQLFIPLTGLALISLASPSYADSPIYTDDKVFPGSQCQPVDGLETDVLRGPGYIYHNASPNKKLLVTCPILRDNIGNIYSESQPLGEISAFGLTVPPVSLANPSSALFPA